MLNIRASYAFLIALALVARTPRTEANEWSGTQVMVSLSGERAVNDTLGVRFQGAQFMIPSEDFRLSFLYAGPTISLEFGRLALWISPQLVGGLGYFEGDAYGPSVWASATFAGRISLFAELDRWFAADDQSLWYGAYAADLILGPVNLGLQAEHLDADLHGGVHVGMTVGHFRGTIEYHVGLAGNDETNALRFVTSLSY